MRVTPTVDGVTRELDVAPHRTLADVLSTDCGVPGVGPACTDGTCGACTVRAGDDEIRACLMLAVQADGLRIHTRARPGAAADRDGT